MQTQDQDSERRALIQLRDYLAAARPTGLVARIRRRLDIRRLDGLLEYEDARHDGTDVFAAQRRWVNIGIPLIFAVGIVRSLFFSTHVLSVGRAAFAVVLYAGTGAGLLAFAAHSYRRQAQRLDRVYQRWLERARALPRGGEKSLRSSSAAV